MRKITAAIFFLTAAILYAVDRIGLHLTEMAIYSTGIFPDVGHVDNIVTIIFASLLAFLGIFMLVTSKKEA